MGAEAEVTYTEVPDTLESLWNEYNAAKAARARWDDEEKRIKGDILAFLGYDPDDEKPQPVTAVTHGGVPIFQVSIGRWTGLDFKYFKENHPDVYAACEKSKSTLSLKSA